MDLVAAMDQSRPSETPLCYANAERGRTLRNVRESFVQAGSFLKFAEFSGKLDSSRSDYCPNFETLVLQSSPGTVYRDGAGNQMSKFGEFSIHGGDTSWTWTSDREVGFQHFYLSKMLLADIFRRRTGQSFSEDTLPVLTGASDPGFVKILELAASEFKANPDMTPMEIDAWAILIAENLLRKVTDPAEKERMIGHKSAFPREVRIAVDWIEDNLSGDISVQSLSSVVGISPTNLHRALRSATGMPPHQYVTARRIEKAQQLLCGAQLSIAQIAYQTGFSSQAHFTDVFRRKVGTTPGQYRKDMSS